MKIHKIFKWSVTLATLIMMVAVSCLASIRANFSPTTIRLTSHESQQKSHRIERNQTKSFVLGGFEINESTIVSLSRSGRDALVLIVPSIVHKIEWDVFYDYPENLNRIIFEASNDLVIAPNVFRNLPRTVNYYIIDPALKEKLIAAGTKGQIYHAEYGEQKQCILSENHKLMGLATDLNYETHHLQLPDGRATIATGSYGWSPRMIEAIFLSDCTRPIKTIEPRALQGVCRETVCFVYHDETAVNLIHSGVHYLPIKNVHTNVRYDVCLDGSICKKDRGDKYILVGFDAKRKDEKIVAINYLINVVGENAFKKVQPEEIYLYWFNPKNVMFEKKPFQHVAKTTNYFVQSELMKQKLIAAGTNKEKTTVTKEYSAKVVGAIIIAFVAGAIIPGVVFGIVFVLRYCKKKNMLKKVKK